MTGPVLEPGLRRLLGNPQQLVTVDRLVRADGPAAGSGVLLIRNPGGISLEVLLDRAMDIGWADAPGFPLAWRSPRGHVDPARQEPAETGWVQTFAGGLLTTCGLSSTGMASTVDGVEYGLHGRVGNIPAENVRHGLVQTDDGHPAVEIVGDVVEAALGGPNLRLTRRILVLTDRAEVRIEDTVTNDGFSTAGHMFRHHFNLGYPAIRGGAVVKSTAEPFGLRDDGELPSLPWRLQGESELPEFELAEKVVYCRPDGEDVTTRVTGTDGRWIEISNPSGPWPFLILWRDPRPGVNVLGVEPSTSKDGGRAQAEADGEVLWLEPGQSLSYGSAVRAGAGE